MNDAPLSGKPETSDALARRCAGLRDPQMRVAYVTAQLHDLDPKELAELTATVLALSRAVPMFADLLLSMVLALSDERLGARRTQAAQRASEAGLSGAADLLGHHDPETPEFGELRVPDFGKGRPLTLGERKTLARKRDRRLLARVVRDPHPDVISILLGNPSLTEDDVIRLSATRPVDPKTLRCVFESVRWAIRYRVRRTLLQNPYFPLDLALRAAALLTATDARALARSPDLRTPIRETCLRVGRFELQ